MLTSMVRSVSRLASPFRLHRLCSTSVMQSIEQKPNDRLKIEWHLDGQVARLVMCDRRRRNALSLGMINQLHEQLRELDVKPEVRAVIISSNGPVFSAGHDLNELTTEAGTVQHRKVFAKCTEMLEFIQQMQVPVIAEVDGICAAAGTQLVASCDIVVSSGRSSFSVPGIKLGLFCSTPGIPLARCLPRKIALDLLMTGRPLNSDAALKYGLVSRVVSWAELERETMAVAESICEMSRSVTALGKAFFYAQLEQNMHTANRQGAAVMCENLKMRDAQDGIAAFLSKRKSGMAKWTHTDEKVIKE